MEENESNIFTQDEVVAGLHKRGYTNVNKRWVALLRTNELLPPFDVMGRGRGKSRGRESSAWSNGEAVMEQAVQVCDLFKIYKHLDDLHLPLWMLGYDVPLKRAR